MSRLREPTSLRVGLGAVSGLMVSRLLMPRGRGELAILLYFPTLMAAFFSLGTPQAITALHLQRRREHTEEVLTTGFRLADRSGSSGSSPLHALCAAHADRRQSPASDPGADILRVRRLYDHRAVLQCHGLWLEALYMGQCRYACRAGGLCAGTFCLVVCGALTPLAAVLSALGSQLLQCLLHLIHIKPSWLNSALPRGAYRQCLGLGIRFAAPSLAAVVLLNADRAILIRTTTLEQIGYFAIAFAVTMPMTMTTEAFTQIGFVEVSSAENADASFALMLRRFQMAQVVAGSEFSSRLRSYRSSDPVWLWKSVPRAQSRRHILWRWPCRLEP